MTELTKRLDSEANIIMRIRHHSSYVIYPEFYFAFEIGSGSLKGQGFVWVSCVFLMRCQRNAKDVCTSHQLSNYLLSLLLTRFRFFSTRRRLLRVELNG